MAMILALITMVLGSLLISPTLYYAATAVQATEIKERRTGELYAADAGVENAIWELASNNLTLAEGDQTTLPPIQLNNSLVQTTVFHVPAGKLPTYRITSTANSTGSSETTIESQVYIGNPLFSNALASETDIVLGNNCMVNGDIYYDNTLTYNPPLTHNGEEINGGLSFPTVEDNALFAAALQAEAAVGGTYSGNLNVSSDGTLGPLYITGNLVIDMDTSVNLTGTIYVEGTITCRMGSVITGSGNIIAVGNITFDKVNDYGSLGASVIMSLAGDIHFKKEADIAALVYAPAGSVRFEMTSTVSGSIIANDVWLKQDSTVTFNESIHDLDLPSDGPHVQSWQIK